MERGTGKVSGFDARPAMRSKSSGKQLGEKWTRRTIHFDERQWDALVSRAKATPGVRNPTEFIRLAIERSLSRPPHRPAPSSRTAEGSSALTALTSARQRGIKRTQ
jgi:hypothetical protein